MMHLDDEERRLFVRFLKRALRLDGEHTIDMLVGDESDFSEIVQSHGTAADVRDALCEHWNCPSSTDDYDGEFICVDCGEEFDDVEDLNERSEETRLSADSSASPPNKDRGDHE